MKLRDYESTSTNVTRTFTVTLRERTIRGDKKKKREKNQIHKNVLKTSTSFYIKKKKISK